MKSLLPVIVAVAVGLLAAPAARGVGEKPGPVAGTSGKQPVYCLQGWESFLPGDYYACRALYHLQRNHPSQALEMLREAAYWANKGAQHSLGLVYVNGDIAGVGIDRALGIAWLALAAERKDPVYVHDYSVVAATSSPAELARATRIYLRLRKDYGDRAAGPRAVRRFLRRIRPLDDAAASGGNFAWIQGLSPFPQGAMELSRTIHAHADQFFEGLQGTVSVGALERVEAPSPVLREKYRTTQAAPASSD